MTNLLEQQPRALVDALLERDVPRVMLLGCGAIVPSRVSDPRFEWLAGFLANPCHEVYDHEALFLAAGTESRALFGAFVHKTQRGQAQGGVRNWNYDTVESFLRDGLRLSVGMGRKCALADLWWGGGKAIICPQDPPRDRDARRTMFREFGEFVTSLRGIYITAEDAGTTPHDMEVIHRHTRFATCIPERFGGSGNPSAMTARGVVRAMQAALDHKGLGDLADKQIAMQGAGNVGSFMIERLFEAGVARVVASEIDEERCRMLAARYPGHFLEIRHARPGDQAIFEEPCDIVCANALGGVYDAKTIERVRATVVCGAANNPLADERRDAQRLRERGITYVPDYVANRMGIVACSNEQAGSLPGDPYVERHFDGPGGWAHSIYNTTRAILEHADREIIATTAASEQLADAATNVPHPVWGHRAHDIIEALWREGWADERD
ncbi:MAG: Glu/Leu/Phe/Val dehydrogenase dimerization domain-containing protein [Myxococcota bacterium]|jgi:glutamate dehydrogenase/leucine dehydrogenase|nr:Glu/Leu/Phe/Val dehydrogenase dimerization domain-containing protein [Myxococcota bacterium]